MSWLKENWLWFLLAIVAAFVGYEVVMYLWNETGKQPSSCWFNSLKFWKADNQNTTGSVASGSNCGGRSEAASCVPASARTE